MICNKSSDSESDYGSKFQDFDTYQNAKSEFAYDEDSSDLSKDDNMSDYSNYAIKDIKADFEWIDNEFEALAFDSIKRSDEKIIEIEEFECEKGGKFVLNNDLISSSSEVT
jgi:hypothetical protein